jgi:hypothetical protein
MESEASKDICRRCNKKIFPMERCGVENLNLHDRYLINEISFDVNGGTGDRSQTNEFQ